MTEPMNILDQNMIVNKILGRTYATQTFLVDIRKVYNRLATI